MDSDQSGQRVIIIKLPVPVMPAVQVLPPATGFFEKPHLAKPTQPKLKELDFEPEKMSVLFCLFFCLTTRAPHAMQEARPPQVC